jgi:hypothetical protein
VKKVAIALLAAGFVVLGVATNYEVPLVLLLGWISFLARVLSRITWDWGTLAVSAAALVLFTAGVHFIGWSWRRRVPAAARVAGPAWKVRWSVAVVGGLFLLFAAGVCLIGIAHQVAWLAAADEPLLGETVGATSSEINLKFIAVAAANGSGREPDSFPPGGTFTEDGRMLHGWEVHCLPYLGYVAKEIDFNEPWNGPRNAPYFRCIIPGFINSQMRSAPLTDADGFGLSHYAANSRVMGPGKGMKVSDITDGAANTILIGEVNANFRPWGHPINWRDPAKGINKSPDGFGGPRSSGGALFAMADGSVRFVNEGVSPTVLRALATPNGGEEVDPSVLEDPR